jgi:hypothetical protein
MTPQGRELGADSHCPEVTLTEVSAHAQQSSADGRAGRFRHARRYLAGFSAAGVAVGLVLTGAATGSAAPESGGAGSQASRVITLTSNASSSAGHLTVRFMYKLGKRGAIVPLSFTYSGGSPLKITHPALIISLRPVPGPFIGKPVQVKVRPRAFVVIVRIHNVRDFSGKLPAKDLPRIDWVAPKSPHQAPIVPSAVIETSLGSVGTKKPVNISVLVGMQVGILLNPAAIAPRP